VVRDADGQLHARDHPSKETVTLTVEATAYRRSDGLYFHGERLTAGERVILDYGTVVVNGTVSDIDT
jgi:hypothetical protein